LAATGQFSVQSHGYWHADLLHERRQRAPADPVLAMPRYLMVDSVAPAQLTRLLQQAFNTTPGH